MDRTEADVSNRHIRNIKKSGLSIYDPIEIGDPDLWIPTSELEALLDNRLQGISLAGLALRTRSKVAKEHVCRVLGYPVPSSFRKTQPRFPGQLFDTYVLKGNNLQVWNEELSPSRRYVILRVDGTDLITRVKVVYGEELAQLDTTGTLTRKYQARLVLGEASKELVAMSDTDAITPHIHAGADLTGGTSPVDDPTDDLLLPISEVFERLQGAIGRSFADAGRDQERGRGADLHRIVCELLGYPDYRDNGRFPDVRNQLLEVKMQTSPTIDLGLVRPNSEEWLDVPKIAGTKVRYCDVRYALFYGQTDGIKVTLTHFYLTTGACFFTRFPQIQGKVRNEKIQIPLPSNFFDR